MWEENNEPETKFIIPPPPSITQKKRNIKMFNITALITVLIKTQRLQVKRVN